MKNVKRILHLPNTLSRKSGIMSVIMNYYRNIDRQKVQFDFLCFTTSNDSYEKEILSLGGKIFYIDATKNILRLKKELNKFFKEHSEEYSIVHYHAISMWNIALSIAPKYNINNLIAHSHATVYGEKLMSKIKNYLLCLPLKKQANIYFACSKAAGQSLYGAKLIKEKKVTILNNAVDINKFRYNKNFREEYRKNFGWKDKYVIGHIGRFNEQKNHDLLIDIFYELKKKKRECILVLIGEGPLKYKIEQKVKKLGLIEDVIFLGGRSDVAQLLQGIDIFVLPSLFEGLPVSGVEAQAAGLPCIMSDTITKEVGLIGVEFLDISSSSEEWAEKILKYNSYKRVDTQEILKSLSFDIVTEAQKLEEYYMKL